MLALRRGGTAALSDSLPAWLVRALAPAPDDPLDRPPAARAAQRRRALLEASLEAADIAAVRLAGMPRRDRRALYRQAWDLLGVAQQDRESARDELVERMQVAALRLLRAGSVAA